MCMRRSQLPTGYRVLLGLFASFTGKPSVLAHGICEAREGAFKRLPSP